MAGSFGNSATAVINDILTQEANRIGSDIYKDTLHVSPWISLIKQSAFPDGMGYQLNTLIYDRALPLKSGTLASNPVIGLNWDALSNNFASSARGFTDGQTNDLVGPSGNAGGSGSKATVDFTRRLKSYSLKRAVVESPRLNIEDLRFAAYRQEQLRAIMDLLKEVTRNSWENRYRDEFDRVCGNYVLCKATGTAIVADADETKQTFAVAGAASSTTKIGDVDASADDGTADINANVSNKILDSIYYKLVRAGAGSKSYGKENGRPVFALVLSSEASYALQTEAGFRDDVRYNNSKVSDLIAPLGVEKSFRGFYHLVDDLAPRYAFNATTDALERVEPYTISSGVAVPNSAYDTAAFEAAYVMTDEVMESLVPNPITSAGNGISFNPVNYRGEFKWTNIPDIELNPDGTVGFFRGILASASKPIKTAFGYAIIFQRTSTTPAA